MSDSRWRELTSNHRYTTSTSEVEAMKANGWVEEGVAMCVPL